MARLTRSGHPPGFTLGTMVLGVVILAATALRGKEARASQSRPVQDLATSDSLGVFMGSASGPSPTSAGDSADSLHDPALRMGTLPNGLRYYIRAHESPAGRAELRLAVNVGSVQEDDDQQGLAHFLEHMAFNGTTRFPGHELIDFVETSGMRFGADLNAYTSYDETVYMLTVPTDAPTFLERGLTVLQDWAGGGVTIDSTEVVAERGVVMSEWRSRLADTASQSMHAHYDSLFFGDSRYRTRKPIGDTALVANAEPGPLRRFYEDWYRPELMAVVIVGDVDPTAMEREVRERFGQIPAATNPRPWVAEPLKAPEEPIVDVYRGPVTPHVQVLWPAPPAASEPRAAMRQQLVTSLLLQHLDRRLLRIREQPSRPFIVAQLQRGRVARPLELVGFDVIAWPDSLERGLATVLTEIERVAQHGIRPATLEQQKEAMLRQLEHAAASAGARPSQAYATAYVQHYFTGEDPLLSAQQELALARELIPAITPEVLAEAARFWRDGAGRRVFVGLPTFANVRPPTRETILALFDSVARTPLAPDEVVKATDGPLLARAPEPGRIVRETQHAAAGITEWTLGNGARVLLKSSAADPDEVLLRAWSPGGFSLVPDSLFHSSGRMVAKMMTQAAGLGTHDRSDVLDQLSTGGVREFSVDIGYADEEIRLAGSPKELETLFQMLYLQFSAPRLDTASLAAWKSYAKYQRPELSIHDQLNQIFARGNPRLLPVSTHLAELARLDEAMAVYENRFGNAGDFTFTIVGAVTAEQVQPLVERYLGSLPASRERETPRPASVVPFRSVMRRAERTLEIPKAIVLTVFDGELPTTPREYLEARTELSTLGTILTGRLRDRLREKLAATYSPQVAVSSYALAEEHYRVVISFDSAPERLDEVLDVLDGVLDTLRTEVPAPDELARSRTIQQRQLETQLQSNSHWLQAIGLHARLGIPFDRIPAPHEGEIAAERWQAVVERYLPPDVFIQITNAPKETAVSDLSEANGRGSLLSVLPRAPQGDDHPADERPAVALVHDQR